MAKHNSQNKHEISKTVVWICSLLVTKNKGDLIKKIQALCLLLLTVNKDFDFFLPGICSLLVTANSHEANYAAELKTWS